jgi:uncharacterized membrane protein YphA (DoxX/SURF4 family)
MNTRSHDDPPRLRSDHKPWRAATLFARAALSAGFLSAVADRFGLWGAAGTSHVAWGNLDDFTQYVHVLAPYIPSALLGAVAWGTTLVEIVVGVALLLGIALRWTALLGGVTLLAFGLSMFFFSGYESPLSASVFTAASAAMLVSLAPSGSYVLSLDQFRWSRQQRERVVQ